MIKKLLWCLLLISCMHIAPVFAAKERLVLMPLRVSDEDKNLQGAMETALVKGLQQKYEVFSGEQVAKKARDIFNKESRNTAKKECDETRCMQGIAEAFQAELIATTNITKRDGGYFLALSIQNIFDNKVVYSESLPCKNCDAFAVVEKLKILGGIPVPQPELATKPVALASQPDDEQALWSEVQRGGSKYDYEVYLATYPKGVYAVLARSRMNQLNNQSSQPAIPAPASAKLNPADVSGVYLQKSNVAQVLALLSPLRSYLLEYFQSEGQWPTSWESMGLKEAEMNDGQLIDRIRLEKDGEMRAMLKPQFGASKFIALRPRAIMGGMNMNWDCTTNLPALALPAGANCGVLP